MEPRAPPPLFAPRPRRGGTDGTIVSLRRGRFTLADRGQPARVARALRGVLGLESAAIWHHWAVKEEPLLPVVLVARGRIITDADRRIADVRRTDLPPSDVLGIATSPLRTALDCARSLLDDAALAVADAALRAGDLDRDELLIAARESPRTGRSRAVRVAEAADPRAATAFESVVRAISHDVPGLDLVPQVPVLPRGHARPGRRTATPRRRVRLVDVPRGEVRVPTRPGALQRRGARRLAGAAIRLRARASLARLRPPGAR